MTNFVLAADPILPWSTLFSTFAGRTLVLDDNSYILDGAASGVPATIEIRGIEFDGGVGDGEGLLDGTAQVNLLQATAGGQVIGRVDNTVITGPLLALWISGDGTAFEQAAFAGDDVFVLSNAAEAQSALGGNDRMDGRGGNDTLLGAAGDDTLVGGGGDDRIEGGDGQDLIAGGPGQDSADGGTGLDVFAAGALRRQTQVGATDAGVALSGPDGQDALAAFERIAFADGVLHLDPAGAAGQVWRLYGAAFGREPETFGLSGWVQALDAGAVSLAGAANGFLGSAEFAQRYGQLDNAGFVSRLYGNVLGRAPDAAGLENWTARLANGASRAEVLLGFSESAEYRAATGPATANRLWTVDPEAVDVLRAYMTVLDRQPDADGLLYWTAARNGGLANTGVVDAFVSSAEFQTRFGALSNRDFVERLYLSALDRPADAAGRDDWTAKLDSGALARRDVVLSFANSDEMTQKLLPLVGDGVAFV